MVRERPAVNPAAPATARRRVVRSEIKLKPDLISRRHRNLLNPP
jgi:hypothetical protein